MVDPKNLFRMGVMSTLLCCGLPVLLAGDEMLLNYDDYSSVLASYVDDRGMVSYWELKANRQKLDAFTASMSSLDPSLYESWTEAEKIALWINAYNAYTLQAIIDHYPIKATFFRSLVFPKNSIQQIPGVWEGLRFGVAGRRLTLRQIEHGILRKEFDEPRLHMALVCASIGCPPLRREPYTGKQLESQLDDQTRQFLSSLDKFRIDRDKSRVYLSKIFEWYAEDFVPTFGADRKFSSGSSPERAVLNFVSRYLNSPDRQYLETVDVTVRYLDYDWSLNEQAAKISERFNAEMHRSQ